eukprot:TRINITY_DN29874_c0_g1_i1.p1 TRINITY_DN29874_c0_g1~~TRINITY_DN29874_c0_g1_i1.p1  ORF type:complete len:827 (-),score=127.28 TRINITY_DN29874_c0_g1_i1:227-2707(-)
MNETLPVALAEDADAPKPRSSRSLSNGITGGTGRPSRRTSSSSAASIDSDGNTTSPRWQRAKSTVVMPGELAMDPSASIGVFGSLRSQVPIPRGAFKTCQSKIGALLKSTVFDAIMGLVIVANAMTIGIEQSLRQHNETSQVLVFLEHFFLLAYTGELVLRCFATSLTCIADRWVQFDLVLVLFGWLELAIVAVMKDSASSLGPVMVLRSARLLRLARTMRLLRGFKELWMLVRGLTESVGTICCTFFLLLTVVYVFSCMSMELVTMNAARETNKEFDKVVSMYFSSLPQTMLTLMQFVCLDSIGQIYKPLIEGDYVLAIFFIGVLLILPIVLMNLVTAVIVEGAIEALAHDKEAAAIYEEQERKRLTKELLKILRRIDEDRSGYISREEIESLNESDGQIITKLVGGGKPIELFDSVDLDDSGEIEITEFCDLIYKVSLSKVSPEARRMEKQINEVHFNLRNHELAQMELLQGHKDIMMNQAAMLEMLGLEEEAQKVEKEVRNLPETHISPAHTGHMLVHYDKEAKHHDDASGSVTPTGDNPTTSIGTGGSSPRKSHANHKARKRQSMWVRKSSRGSQNHTPRSNRSASPPRPAPLDVGICSEGVSECGKSRQVSFAADGQSSLADASPQTSKEASRAPSKESNSLTTSSKLRLHKNGHADHDQRFKNGEAESAGQALANGASGSKDKGMVNGHTQPEVEAKATHLDSRVLSAACTTAAKYAQHTEDEQERESCNQLLAENTFLRAHLESAKKALDGFLQNADGNMNGHPTNLASLNDSLASLSLLGMRFDDGELSPNRVTTSLRTPFREEPNGQDKVWTCESGH